MILSEIVLLFNGAKAVLKRREYSNIHLQHLSSIQNITSTRLNGMF